MKFFSFFIFSLIFSFSLHASENQYTHRQKALKFFKDQDFKSSLKEWALALSKDPENPYVLYNFGLTAQKLKKPAWAKAAWTRSFFQFPFFSLSQKALKQEGFHLPTLPSFSFFLPLELALILCLFSLFVLLHLWRKKKSLVFMSFFFILSFSLISIKVLDTVFPYATVISGTSVYLGPGLKYTSLSSLPPRTLVKVKKEEGPWALVETENQSGWIKKENLFLTIGDKNYDRLSLEKLY